MSDTKDKTKALDPVLPDSVELESVFENANRVHDQVSGKTSLGALGDVVNDRTPDERSDDYEKVHRYGGPAKHADPSFFEGIAEGWDSLANRVRQVTPAEIVNSSSRISFGLRAGADAMSVYSGMKYASPLRTAGSLITLTGLGLGTIFKEKPQTKEERERYAQMPLYEYIPMRIGHAFDPANHITATVGLATIPNGILLAASGLQQSQSHVIESLKQVRWNNLKPLKVLGSKGAISAELWTGLMTVAAGSAMNFIPDPDRAWQVSTGIFLTRTWPAYKNAASAYKTGRPAVANPLFPEGASAANPRGAGYAVWKEFMEANPGQWKAPPGDWMQLGKFWLNQTSNFFGLMYGGVHKLPDGTILKMKREDPEPAKEPMRDDAPAIEQPQQRITAPGSEIARVSAAPDQGIAQAQA